MLIIIDADTNLRKKLCDILKKERIIPVDSVTAALEKICHFRSEINVVIANLDFLPEIHERQTIKKVCYKLFINEPPIIGYYTQNQEKMSVEFTGRGTTYPLLKCDEADMQFPDLYIAEIVKVYPELHYDLKKAYYYWAKTPEQVETEYIDPRQWLQEQGFIEILELAEKEENKSPVLENTILAIKAMLETRIDGETRNFDYKQLYLDTKKQYDQLTQYVRDLIEMIK